MVAQRPRPRAITVSTFSGVAALGVMGVPGGRIAPQRRSFHANRTFSSFRTVHFISVGVMSL